MTLPWPIMIRSICTETTFKYSQGKIYYEPDLGIVHRVKLYQVTDIHLLINITNTISLNI